MHLEKEEEEPANNDFFERVKLRFILILDKLMPRLKTDHFCLLRGGYRAGGLLALLVIGKDMMPKLNNGQFQVRLDEPQGTRFGSNRR